MSELQDIQALIAEKNAAIDTLYKEREDLRKKAERLKYEEECKKFGIEKCCKNCRYNCLTYVGNEYNYCLQVEDGWNSGKDCDSFAPANKLSRAISDLPTYKYTDDYEHIASLLGYGDVSLDTLCAMLDADDELADAIIKFAVDFINDRAEFHKARYRLGQKHKRKDSKKTDD